MLALAPERVKLDLARPGSRRPIGQLLPQLRRTGVRSVSPNGVLGDPTRACASDGEMLLAAAAADLVAAHDQWNR